MVLYVLLLGSRLSPGPDSSDWRILTSRHEGPIGNPSRFNPGRMTSIFSRGTHKYPAMKSA